MVYLRYIYPCVCARMHVDECACTRVGVTSHGISSEKSCGEETCSGTSLVAQWLRLHAPNAGGPGSIPGQGTRSNMHAAAKSSHATTKEPTCRN